LFQVGLLSVSLLLLLLLLVSVFVCCLLVSFSFSCSLVRLVSSLRRFFFLRFFDIVRNSTF